MSQQFRTNSSDMLLHYNVDILIINTTATIIEKSLLRMFRPSAGAIVRNKLFSIILAVVFMIKIFTFSQVYHLPM